MIVMIMWSIFIGAAPNDSMTECMNDADGDGFGDMDPGYLQCFDIEILHPISKDRNWLL